MTKVLVAESEMAEKYYELGKLIKQLEDERAEYKSSLSEYAKKEGEVDEKGSYIAEAGEFEVTLQARQSVNIDDDAAEKLLKSKNLWKDCSVEVLDESKFENAVKKGKITLDELKNITSKTVSYALRVDKA